MKRYVPKLFCLLLCLCLLSVHALAVEDTDNVMIAVNLDLGSSTDNTSSLLPNVREIQIDPYTGQTRMMVDADLPEFAPIPETENRNPFLYSQQTGSADYTTDSTMKILDNQNGNRNMRCLYIGTYCTVWGCTSDDEAVMLSQAYAQSIGEQFDSNCQTMVDSFGSWYDADGDNKLAIFCYDISNDYKNNKADYHTGSYIGGFFYGLDLMMPDNRINGILFGGQYRIGMDCIHLDTYPAMGNIRATPFSNIEKAYSTLYHEMQHLINFSYQIADSSSAMYNTLSMPTYLNEAFSMAAEHLIGGPESCTDRVSYFNSTKYQPGSSLTTWEKTLSGYSNSYLFGQYLRTRYAQLLDDGSDGSTFYANVLSGRSIGDHDTLAFIADMLDDTPQNLIKDFWSAVYKKDAEGTNGFAGEAWANSIFPRIQTLPADLHSVSIGSGGAIYYTLTDSAQIPESSEKLTFLIFESRLRAAMENGTIRVNVSATCSGSVTVGFYDAVTERFLGFQTFPLSGSEINTLFDVTETRFDLSSCTWKVMMTSSDYIPLCTSVTSNQ